jgi:hypothetical protein
MHDSMIGAWIGERQVAKGGRPLRPYEPIAMLQERSHKRTCVTNAHSITVTHTNITLIIPIESGKPMMQAEYSAPA